MVNKTYWKDVRRTIIKTKGRFVSLVLLLFLGTLVLVGLKSTIPDMEAKGQSYFRRYQTMDLTVMADYGLSRDDQAELDQLDGMQIEYSYWADVTLSDSHQAVRLFSYDQGQTISQYEVVKGHLPEKKEEIALTVAYQASYAIGDKVTIETDDAQLRQKTYRISGFVNSSEIISQVNKGLSRAGDGQLDGYAVVSPEVFEVDVYTIARIRLDALSRRNPFRSTYARQVAKAQAVIEEALADNGERRLAQLREPIQKEVADAQARIASGEGEIKAQESQLAQLGSFLSQEEQTSYQQKIAQAKAELAAAKSAVAKGKESLSTLLAPNYYVYTRKTLPVGTGYLALTQSMEGIGVVSDIFPMVLYVVAALVAFTTMTRFVDEERLNAGLLQALGYGSRTLMSKFVSYGLAASSLGTVLGALAGTFLLPLAISSVSMGTLTIGAIKPLVHWPYIGLACLLSLMSAVLPAYLVARRDLSNKPAALLLPKPPMAGSRIALESISFLWRRMSFTQKVTARNIFRYKQRMLMTIFGVMGSVALLFTGLGIRSSVGGVVASQFEESMRYDMRVVKKSGISQLEQTQLDQALKDPRIATNQAIYSETSDQKVPGLTDQEMVTVLVSDEAQFDEVLRLYDPKGQALNLTDQGVVLSQKLARLYGLGMGDDLPYVDADGQQRHLKIVGLSRLYAGHFILMNRTYYEKAFGQSLKTNSYLISLKDKKHLSRVSADLLNQTGLVAVVRNDLLIKTLDALVVSLNGVMQILVVLSISLAVVVLYNLTSINVAERIRELSTIKVLGFFNREVTLYIYRETVVLSLLGIVLGLGSGFALHRYIIGRLGSTAITFEPRVGLAVYLIPILAVTSILLAMGWLVNHRLKHLDMLEALKSID